VEPASLRDASDLNGRAGGTAEPPAGGAAQLLAVGSDLSDRMPRRPGTRSTFRRLRPSGHLRQRLVAGRGSAGLPPGSFAGAREDAALGAEVAHHDLAAADLDERAIVAIDRLPDGGAEGGLAVAAVLALTPQLQQLSISSQSSTRRAITRPAPPAPVEEIESQTGP
jgi:hypothetical protein